MKIVTAIAGLPAYTQVSVLYPVLGSVNASMLSIAQREIARQEKALSEVDRVGKPSIDKYNEYVALLGRHAQDAEWNKISGQEERLAPEVLAAQQLSRFHDFREPLVAIFNEAHGKMPSTDGSQSVFSFKESLALQMAREATVIQATDDAEIAALISQDVVTIDEINEAEALRHERDLEFKREFGPLILDMVLDAEDTECSYDDRRSGDDAFEELPAEYQMRLIARMIPKLHISKMSNLNRRSYDLEATTNVLIIGLVEKACKKAIGFSEVDGEQRIAALAAALGGK